MGTLVVTDKWPMRYLRKGFAVGCCAILAATMILYYHFSYFERTIWKFSRTIVTKNDSYISQDLNQTQVRTLVNATYPTKISQSLTSEVNMSGTTVNGIHENCSLTWNQGGLDIQAYERISSVTKETRTEKKLDMQPFYSNPKIVLNPDKYLLPALVYGPNNQLVGFRESLFTAIMLNRTFVIPLFIKHGSDKQKNISRFVAPVHRIDLESLCTFVSCITIDQFRKGCNGLVQALINTRFLDLKQVRNIERKMRLRILPPDANDTSLLSNMFVPPRTASDKTINVFQADEIEKYFTTQAKCVVQPLPFLNLHGMKKGRSPNLHGQITEVDMQDKNASKEVQLMISVMRHTQHPKYLKALSRLFQKHFAGDEPYLSVHWRYNVGDFLSNRRCGKSEKHMKLCDAARKFTNKDIAKHIEEILKSLKASNITVQNVYMASPRNEINRIKAVADILKEKQGIKTFTSLDLDAFLQRYSDCGFLEIHWDDIISTLEMEICSNGIAFIGSHGTWSKNVRIARLFSDDPLLDKSRHNFL